MIKNYYNIIIIITGQCAFDVVSELFMGTASLIYYWLVLF